MMIWLVNRTAWIVPCAIWVGALVGIPIVYLIFPMASLWVYVAAFLLATIAPVAILARHLIFWIGISDEKIVFKRLLRTIEIKKAEVVSIDVNPPINPSDLTKSCLKVKDRRVTFRFHGGESIEFSPIEGQIAHRLLEAFKER